MHEPHLIAQMSCDMLQKKQPHALATVVRCELPSSGKPGQKAVIDAAGQLHGWVGGGCAEPTVISEAETAIREGKPRLIRITPKPSAIIEDGITEVAMTCHSGGVLDIFIEPVLPRKSLLIAGTSEAGESLVVSAKQLGFEVTVAGEMDDENRFAGADRVISGFDLGELEPDLVVIATQGKKDEQAIQMALATHAKYIGFIASARKWEKLKTILTSNGVGEHGFARIKAPAGLDLGAQTPAEIALSVAAELLQFQRQVKVGKEATHEQKASGACCSSSVRSIELPVINSAFAARSVDMAIDPICGMSVLREGAQYVSTRNGEAFFFCCSGCLNLFEKKQASR